MEFLANLERVAGAVERRLDRLLVSRGAPKEGARLGEAMRYATIGGGKRLRPFLLIELARLFGVKRGAGPASGLRARMRPLLLAGA